MSNTKIPTEELEVFMTLEGVNVVFDVGAREDLDMYELRPDIEYHLFEPVQEYCEILIDKANGAKNIYINQFALGDREGDFEYNAETQSFYYKGEHDTKYSMNTLDWYAKNMNVQPDFIKIDTEGLDLYVIAGAQETLKKTKYIQFEYWNGIYDFLPYLQDFNLHLMIEPKLREAIKQFTQHEDFNNSLVPLNNNLVRFMYNRLIFNGYGGNILCIRK